MTILVQELRAEIAELKEEIASLEEHRQFLDGLRETFGYDSWTSVVAQLERLKKAQVGDEEPVAYWNPSVDLDQAAFSYANSPSFPVPLFRGAAPSAAEPVAIANRGECAFWVRWTEAAEGLYGPGIKLYAAPPAAHDDAARKDAARYRWIEPVFAGLFGITSMDEYIDRAMAKEQT